MKNIQEDVAFLYKKRGYTDDILTLALGLCEEAGEVAKAVNTFYNPRYIISKVSLSDSLQHELCDILIYLFAIANTAGIDLQSAMEYKLECAIEKEPSILKE